MTVANQYDVNLCSTRVNSLTTHDPEYQNVCKANSAGRTIHEQLGGMEPARKEDGPPSSTEGPDVWIPVESTFSVCTMGGPCYNNTNSHSSTIYIYRSWLCCLLWEDDGAAGVDGKRVLVDCIEGDVNIPHLVEGFRTDTNQSLYFHSCSTLTA